jgi:RND family efflux transporter MFP subunit
MKTPISFVAAAALAGFLTAACSTPQVSAERASRPGDRTAFPVKTHVVTLAAAPAPVRYSASIEAREQVSLAFKTSGYVDTVLTRNGADGRSRVAQPGDAILRGTLLARVRDNDYRERVSQGKARLAEADASLVKARLDLDRARALFESQSLTKPELDAAQASFDASTARVAAARADLELAAIALADCALVAPASGVVLERRIELGTLAAAGTIAFVIGDLSSVKAKFGMPDATIATVALGDPIAVTVESAGAATFAGRVTAIAPAADSQSRVFNIEVSIPNADGRLRPGMIGSVAVDLSARAARAAAPRSLTIPLTAVIRSPHDTNAYAVLVVEPQNGVEIARARRVALGEVIGNAVAVTEGLAAGERVIVSGATLVADGRQVRIPSE